LRGAGVNYNRIAGPNATAGAYNGVLLARLNTDVSLADFEAGVINLVNDVEQAYWDLYFAYRDLNAKLAGRDSALVTWRNIAERLRIGLRGERSPVAVAVFPVPGLRGGRAEHALHT
jgi:hypothetical protein